MGFHPRFCDRGVYPAITTLVLIAVALVAGGLTWIVVKGQSSGLSRNVDVEVQSKNLIFAHKTGQFSVTLKNTGTVRIDDTRVELREIPDYPVLRIFDELGGGAVGIPISNVQELQDIQDDLDNDYYLTQNIDATDTKNWNGGKGFNPIGDQKHPFTGTFDGNGHIIENLYINRGSTDDVGLFGYICSSAIIKNVELRNVNIRGRSWVGGLVGYSYKGARVTDSFWDVDTSGQTSSAGGTGKTTMEMKTKLTFTDAGWDFTDTWRMGTEVITLDMGSISPDQSASASKSFVAPIFSGRTYLVEVTAFDSKGDAIFRETTTVIAGR